MLEMWKNTLWLSAQTQTQRSNFTECIMRIRVAQMTCKAMAGFSCDQSAYAREAQTVQIDVIELCTNRSSRDMQGKAEVQHLHKTLVTMQ